MLHVSVCSWPKTQCACVFLICTMWYELSALYFSVPSEPVVNVSRRVGEPNELLVTWTTPEDPNGIILNYTVYCDEVTSDEEGSAASASGDGILIPEDSKLLNITTVKVVLSGNELFVVVMELIPYTFYDCYVTANTSVGEGNSSMVESVQTDEAGQ